MSDGPMAAVLAGLADIRARMVDLRADLIARLATTDDLTKLRGDLMARMDEHAAQLTSIRDDITANIGASEHVKRANESTREELRTLSDMVFRMVPRIRRLESDLRKLKGQD